MKARINYQRVTVPEAFVTKGRQRVKQYGNSVYLRNGEEFEIELFNPLQTKVLAKIRLNGKYISSSGIVLRPGERVFLERYLDEAKKFLFETYEVNGADPNVREAIKSNGDLEVEFYGEDTSLPLSEWSITYNPSYVQQPSWTYYGDSVTPTITYTSSHTAGCKGVRGPSGNAGVQGDIGCQSAMFLSCDLGNTRDFAPAEQPIETGRVEKGDYSNQGFTADTTAFHSYYSWRSSWKILPESQRPVVKEDLVIYCSSCGAKRKKASHKFCPNCGNQF